MIFSVLKSTTNHAQEDSYEAGNGSRSRKIISNKISWKYCSAYKFGSAKIFWLFQLDTRFHELLRALLSQVREFFFITVFFRELIYIFYFTSFLPWSFFKVLCKSTKGWLISWLLFYLIWKNMFLLHWDFEITTLFVKITV